MPFKETKEEQIRRHRAINWIVSLILIVFAIWSIHLNAQGQSALKSTVEAINETDAKLVALDAAMQTVKEACLSAPIVIPTTPTDADIIQ